MNRFYLDYQLKNFKSILYALIDYLNADYPIVHISESADKKKIIIEGVTSSK